MLRPSYNEQIHGFGFDAAQPITANRVALTTVFGPTISVLTEVVSDQGAKFLHTTQNFHLEVQVSEQGGIGVLVPMSLETRECYSYSMSGNLVAKTSPCFGFVATLEATHAQDTVQAAVIRAILPTRQYAADGGQYTYVTSSGFVRPNVNPSTYGNIANVTGLVFGIGIMREIGTTTVNVQFGISFEVERWINPDVDIRTPVV